MVNKIFFEITDKCNQKCSHCCKTWRKDSGHTMDTKMLDKIISLPKELLTISGGEPGTVAEEVRYIIENEQAKVQINTNLTMWHDDMLALFAERGTMLSVSIVSMNRQAYEDITGTKLYDRMLGNLDKISRGSKITMILNDQNINYAKQSLNSLIVKGFHNFVIQPAIPNGKADKKTFITGMEEVQNLYKTHRNIKISLMSYYTHTEIPVNHLCDAGSDRLVILSNGDVVPCACMNPIILGNIKKNKWPDIQTAGAAYADSFHGEEKFLCKGFLEKFGMELHNQNNDYPKQDELVKISDIPQVLGNIKYVLAYIGYEKNARYLDLGSNSGMLYEMLPSNIQYTGVDINQQNNPDIIQDDIRNVVKTLQQGDYDYIILSGALKFMNNKMDCLQIISASLRSGPKKVICLQKHYGITKEEIGLNDFLMLNSNYTVELIHDDKKSFTANSIVKARGVLFTRRN